MKKIIFLLLLTSMAFAQRIWQFPDADTTLSQALQSKSLLILNQDPTGSGGLNYITRKIALENFLTALSIADTNIVLQNKVNRFFEDNYFYKNWLFATDSAEIRTQSFLSGFGGAGFRINKSTTVPDTSISKGSFTGGWTGEFDNLLVRGTTYLNELQLNQTKVSNGNLFITDAAQVDSVYYLETTNITYQNGDPIVLQSGDTLQAFPYEAILTFQDPTNIGIAPFVVGDLLLYEHYRPLKENESRYLIRTIRGIVTKVVNVKVYLTLDASSVDKETDLRALILPGQTFSRVGNINDETRQGSVYFSINEPNSPKMIVYDEVNSFADWDSFNKTKAVIGNLEGIIDPVFGDLSTSTKYGAYFPGGTLFAQNARLSSSLIVGSTNVNGLNIDSLKNLSLKDLAEVSDLGVTVIANGKLRADIISADSVQAGSFTNISLNTSTANNRITISNGNSIGFYYNDILEASLISGQFSAGVEGIQWTGWLFGGDLLATNAKFTNLSGTGTTLPINADTRINDDLYVSGFTTISSGTALRIGAPGGPFVTYGGISSSSPSGYYVATTPGGSPTYQLNQVTINLAGQTVVVLTP